MKTLQLNSWKLKLADDWDGLRLSQVKRIAPILLSKDVDALRARSKELSVAENPSSSAALKVGSDWYHIRMQLFLIMINVRCRLALQWFISTRLEPEHFAQILTHKEKLVDWLFLKPMYQQVMPTVQVGFHNLIGPRDFLRGVSIGEFEMVQNRYSAWLKTKDRKYLQQLFCILYRKERKDVPRNSVDYARDRRAALNEITTDDEAEKLGRISEDTLLVCVLYWRGCMHQLRNQYKWVFQGAGKATKRNPGELIVKLANSVKPDDINETAKADLHVVMTKLNAENKAEYEQRKNRVRK